MADTDTTVEVITDQAEANSVGQKNGGFSWLSTIHTLILLLGCVLMGVAIGAIGNQDVIGLDFVKLHGYPITDLTRTTASSSDLPNSVWKYGLFYPVGGLFGALIGTVLAEKFGRVKPSILFVALMIHGAILKIVSRYTHIALLFTGRFLDGIGSAGYMVTGLLLTFESLPLKVGKYAKPFIQIGINAGILIISVLLLKQVCQGNWNLSYLFTIIVGVILIIALFLHPESPVYVYSRSRDTVLTEKVLQRLRGKHYDPEELANIKKSIEEGSNVKQMSVIAFLTERKFIMCNISLIVLNLSQQWCGINAVIGFSVLILKNKLVSNPDVYGMLICLSAFCASLILAPFVGTQKRLLLWLIGFVSMFISTLVYIINEFKGGSYITSVIMLSIFVAIFQIGPGPLVWFLSLEMYPPNAINAAQGVASFFNWLANSFIFFLTPILTDYFTHDYYIFIIFATIQFLVILYSVFFVVETYQVPLDIIQNSYGKIQRRICCCL